MIDRFIEPRLRQALGDTPVVLVHGPRQAGKSTLVQSLGGPLRRALTLDDATTLASASAAPEAFIDGFDGPVIIDEVQRVPALALAIKRAVDRDRSPGRFLLTGSANAMFLPQLSEALVGRMELIPLLPLSQGEIEEKPERFIDAAFTSDPRVLRSLAENGRETRASMAARVVRGGFPEPVLQREPSRRRDWVASYVSTILQRDVLELARIDRAVELPRLLAAVAARTASLLNIAELSRDLGMASSTLARHLALLEATNLVTPLRPWSNNRGLRLVKAPKLMLVDSAVAAYLLGVSDDPLADPSLFGRLLEAFVAQELIRQSSWSEARPAAHHFRSHGGAEVDIVLEDRRGRVVGIEVKSATAVNSDDLRGLKALSEVAGERFVRGVVLHAGDSAVDFGPNLHALPLGTLWS